jgi:hypothetical protein
MHDAFKVYTVIEKLPQKIEAIYAQGTHSQPHHFVLLLIAPEFTQECRD